MADNDVAQHTSTDDEVVVRRVQSLLDEVSSLVDGLLLPRDLELSTVAFAGLLRCRDLLADMLLLYEQGTPASVGALARVLFETWGRTFYVLLGDEDAMLQELGEHYRQIQKWEPNSEDERLRELVDEAPKRQSFESIIRSLGGLLATIGVDDSTLLLETYDSLYRMESATSVHGGLTSLFLWQISADDDYVTPRPDFARDIGLKRLRICTGLLELLARYVENNFPKTALD